MRLKHSRWGDLTEFQDTAKPWLRDFRVEQFSETRIIDHALEVVVGTGLEAVSWVELDGTGEVVEAVLSATGDGVEDGQTVKGVVNVWVAIENGEELLAGIVVVAGVELGDGVVVVLFRGGEVEVMLLHLAVAGDDVDSAALHDFHGGVGKQLLESSGGFLVFPLLE